jgi:hypothetical protein
MPAKSVDQYVDEIFGKCCTQHLPNQEAEAIVQNYIRERLKKMRDGYSIVRPLFDQDLIAQLWLPSRSGKNILECIHSELDAVKSSDICAD